MKQESAVHRGCGRPARGPFGAACRGASRCPRTGGAGRPRADRLQPGRLQRHRWRRFHHRDDRGGRRSAGWMGSHIGLRSGCGAAHRTYGRRLPDFDRSRGGAAWPERRPRKRAGRTGRLLLGHTRWGQRGRRDRAGQAGRRCRRHIRAGLDQFSARVGAWRQRDDRRRVEARTAQVNVFAAPVAAVASDRASMAAGVEITWQHVAVNTSYQVWRSTSPYFVPGVDSTVIASWPLPGSNCTLNGETLSCTDPNALATSGQYFYIVQSFNPASATATSTRMGAFVFLLTPGN